jgi:hypothetical protein
MKLKIVAFLASTHFGGSCMGFCESMFQEDLLFCQTVYKNSFNFPVKLLVELKPKKIAFLVKRSYTKGVLKFGHWNPLT